MIDNKIPKPNTNNEEILEDPRTQPHWDNYDDELKAFLIEQYEGPKQALAEKPKSAPNDEQLLLMDRRKIISQLCDVRFKSGITQNEMAQKMGISQSTLARLESANSNPSLKTLVKMARALGVSVRIGKT